MSDEKFSLDVIVKEARDLCTCDGLREDLPEVHPICEVCQLVKRLQETLYTALSHERMEKIVGMREPKKCRGVLLNQISGFDPNGIPIDDEGNPVMIYPEPAERLEQLKVKIELEKMRQSVPQESKLYWCKRCDRGLVDWGEATKGMCDDCEREDERGDTDWHEFLKARGVTAKAVPKAIFDEWMVLQNENANSMKGCQVSIEVIPDDKK